MSLTAELQTQKENSIKNASPEFAAMINRVLAELHDHKNGDNAPKSGAFAADFTLPNSRGEAVNLYDRLKHGPVILAFYRGG